MTTRIALALLALTTSAAADSKSEAADPKLAQFLGRWQGTTSMTIRGTKFEAKGSGTCERASEGAAVVCKWVAAGKDRKLEETMLVGLDRASSTYHAFTINNWGEAYDHVGTWTDAAKVTLTHRGTRDGKALQETYTYEFRKNQIVITGAISVDGKVFAEGTSTLTRAK